jgi:ribose transport system ATP-binding protein
MNDVSVGVSPQTETITEATSPEGRTIRIRGLSKSFGSQKSLIDVDLDIRPGELLGLMGPNGAGKSTLIKILDGVYSRDSGTIELDGHSVRVLGSQPSVAFIHQDLGLIDGLSISANLQLGQRPIRSVGPFLDFKAERVFARKALKAVHLDLDVDQFVGELSPGEKTLVAIARAIGCGATVLFVDEATSTLPTADAHRVTESLKLAAADGATIVMVSHKLNEILETTARIVLLVDGRIVADRPTEGLDIDSLTELLVGHGLAEHVENGQSEPGEALIKLEDVHCGPAGPVNFEVRRGEIVGLTGLSGSGLYQIANVAHGSMRGGLCYPRTGRLRAASMNSLDVRTSPSPQ